MLVPLDVRQGMVSEIQCSLGSARIGAPYEDGWRWYVPIIVESARYREWVRAKGALIEVANLDSPNVEIDFDEEKCWVIVRGPRKSRSQDGSNYVVRAACRFLGKMELRFPLTSDPVQEARIYFQGDRVWGPAQRAAMRAERQATS